MRRLIIGALSGVLATSASFMVLAPPAQADVKTDKPCQTDRYKTNYRIVTAAKQPRITHLSTYAIGPGGTRTTTKTAAFAKRISAAATFASEASVEASGAAKVMAKASAKVSMSLKAAGSRTSKKSQSITETVSNNTRHNVQYVFYAGVSGANGKFRKYYCKFYYVDGQSYGYARVTYKSGKWRSYAIPGEGAVRCGSGTKGLGALAKAAMKLGCRA